MLQVYHAVSPTRLVAGGGSFVRKRTFSDASTQTHILHPQKAPH